MTAGVVAVTDRTLADGANHRLTDVVDSALAGGADAVLLREKDLAADDRCRLAEELRAVTAAHGAELWVASDADLAVAVGADGLHLAAADPLPAPGLDLRLARSCHTVAELRSARDQGIHRVTYSPVFLTESKPGYGPPLGLDRLAAGCRAVPGVTVIALGGLEPGRVRDCVAAGASGVALMGAVMGADDPAAVVRSVIDELTGASP